MAQTRRSTAKKGQGHSVHRKYHSLAFILLDPSTTFGTHETSDTESHPIDLNPQEYRCENIRSHVNVVCCSGCDEQNVEVLCHLRSRVNLIYMQRLNSYRAVNTPQLGYTNQSVNAV